LSLLKKIASETAIYGLSTVVGRLLNYLLVPLHTMVFLPSEYGVYSYLYSYIGFLMVTLTYGFETAFFRFSQEQKEDTWSTAIISLITSTLFFVILFFIFKNNIAHLIDISQHPEYITWFTLIIAFDVLSAIPFAKLRLQGKAFQFAGIKIINIITNVLLNILFLWLCPKLLQQGETWQWLNYIYNVNIGIGYIFIANLVASGLTLVLLLPYYFQQKLQFNFKLWKKMMHYATPLLLVGLAAMVNEVLDRILLKKLLTGTEEYINSQIGIYSACYKLAILMTLFTQAYRMAVEPFFFSTSKQKNATLQYAQLMHYFVLFGGLVFLGVNFFIDIFKYFISNQSYWEGLTVVPVLLLANLFLGIYFNLSVWYKLTDKTIYAAVISIIGAFVTVVLNVLLIPKIGYYGSALTTMFVYLIMCMLSLALGKKYYAVPYSYLKIASILFIAFAMFFVDFYWINTISKIYAYPLKLALIVIYLMAGYALFFHTKVFQFKTKN